MENLQPMLFDHYRRQDGWRLWSSHQQGGKVSRYISDANTLFWQAGIQ